MDVNKTTTGQLFNVKNQIKRENTSSSTAPEKKQEVRGFDEKAAAYEKSSEAKQKSDSSNSTESKVDMKEVKRLINQSNQQTASFVNMMSKLLRNQSNQGIIANNTMEGLVNQIFSNGEIKDNIEVDEQTQKDAQEAIAPGGVYSVEKTAERVLDFAKAISGGDSKKLELLKDAVVKAFEEVAELFGGEDKMPQITKDTQAAIMKGFEDWGNGKENWNEVIQPK